MFDVIKVIKVDDTIESIQVEVEYPAINNDTKTFQVNTDILKDENTITDIRIDINGSIKNNNLEIPEVGVSFSEENTITDVQVDINSAVKIMPIPLGYVKIVDEYSDEWQQFGSIYKVFIPIEEHKVHNIKSIEVLLKDDLNKCFENIFYTYKIYYSGKVAIVLNKKINCKIIIKGEL